MTEVMNVREAAAVLGVHENTIRNYVRDGRLVNAANAASPHIKLDAAQVRLLAPVREDFRRGFEIEDGFVVEWYYGHVGDDGNFWSSSGTRCRSEEVARTLARDYNKASPDLGLPYVVAKRLVGPYVVQDDQ